MAGPAGEEGGESDAAFLARMEAEDAASFAEAVAGWRDHPPGVFALPHPSWRNTGWLNKNPWFAEEVLPRLRAAVSEVMNDRAPN